MAQTQVHGHVRLGCDTVAAGLVCSLVCVLYYMAPQSMGNETAATQPVVQHADNPSVTFLATDHR